jgi:hypothetical protein
MPDEITVSTQSTSPDPAATFQKMLAQKNNDATALASQLFDENFHQRAQIRDLKANAPKEGSMTLSADEAKSFKAYQDLGVEAKDIKKAMERLPELEKQNKELASMESLREIADIGLDGEKLNVSVLKDLAQHKFPDAAFSFRTEKDKDGKESKAAFLKTAPDATEVSFSEYAAQNLSDYIPALRIAAEQQQQQQPGNTHDPKPQGGPTSVFDRIRESVKSQAVTPQVDIGARFGKPANA